MFFLVFFPLVIAGPLLPHAQDGRHCLETEFTCSDGHCIPDKWHCDGEQDCTDGSDEKTDCGLTPCTSNEFECEPGACIPYTWVCDGQPDCLKALDETNCSKSCNDDQFRCSHTKLCIQKLWTCDGVDDCGDGSDEVNCTSKKCGPNDFECSDKHCISKGWRCDGDYDCPDHSDEMGCPNQQLKIPTSTIVTCRQSEYQCKEWSTCIPSTWLCDGDYDCPGHDDESADMCKNEVCREDQFKCKSHQCISGHSYCDGVSDCPDNSDEENCTAASSFFCKENEFDCGGNTCIAINKVCDGKSDCPNNEDEPIGRCHVNECLVDNGGCSDICIDTATGHKCSCLPGYKLRTNKSCEDINECENPGACSHKCINEEGTFKCECFDGYLKDPYDRTRCKPTEGHTYLLFTRKHDIRKLSADQHEMSAIVNNTKSATALDFVFKSGMIFWSDFSERKIYKAPIDEGHVQTVVISNEVTNCDGLAIDWIYDHIYWTDTGKNTIEMAKLDGSMKKTLYSDQLDEPRAIAVNPLDGWMYWSDWGEDARIERGGMDGSHRHVIVSYDIKWPNGLTLDLVRKKLYWVDGKLNSISAVNYDGSERTVILKSGDTLHHPFSIAVFEDFMYWTDWEIQTIFRANKFNGANITALTAGKKLESLMVVHVYHPYRQPNGINYCISSGNKCSHLCLPAPQIHENAPKISCACPQGFFLSANGLHCTDKDVSLSIEEETHLISPPVIVEASHYSNEPPGKMYISIIVLSISLFLVFTSLVAYFIFQNYLRKNITSMNFDNPVYRKTTEDRFTLSKIHPQSHLKQSDATDAQEPLTSDS